MRSAYAPTFQDSPRTMARRRGVSLALVIVIHILLLLMLLRLAPPPSGERAQRGPITLQLLPDTRAEPTQTKAAAAKTRRARSSTTKATPIPKPVVHVPRPPGSTSSGIWSQVIPLTREELAAADIAKMPSRSTADGKSAQANAAGGAGGKAGGGPHGEQLYDADWYRRPTSTELAAYLPKDGPSQGWGEIACKTVPGFRVEDCVELGQSPPGSGFARAVLLASWQFKVLPPRIGGRPQIGTWVRIHIDYIEGDAEGG